MSEDQYPTSTSSSSYRRSSDDTSSSSSGSLRSGIRHGLRTWKLWDRADVELDCESSTFDFFFFFLFVFGDIKELVVLLLLLLAPWITTDGREKLGRRLPWWFGVWVFASQSGYFGLTSSCLMSASKSTQSLVTSCTFCDVGIASPLKHRSSETRWTRTSSLMLPFPVAATLMSACSRTSSVLEVIILRLLSINKLKLKIEIGSRREKVSKPFLIGWYSAEAGHGGQSMFQSFRPNLKGFRIQEALTWKTDHEVYTGSSILIQTNSIVTLFKEGRTLQLISPSLCCCTTTRFICLHWSRNIYSWDLFDNRQIAFTLKSLAKINRSTEKRDFKFNQEGHHSVQETNFQYLLNRD